VVPYPSTDTAFGIWSLNEIRDARRGDNWPEITPPFNPQTETFTYTGSTQTFTIPQGASSVTFKVWGAAGGSSQPNYGTYYGGAGGYSQGTLSVSGGESLNIIVGEGGIRAEVNGSQSAFGGGGLSGGDATDTRRGAGGGGYSGVFLGSVNQSNALIIGGGGGGTTWSWGGDAGSGGYPEGLMGGYYSSDGPDSPGRGGTQTSGGIGGFGGRSDDGLDGSALQGGDAPINSSGQGTSGSGGGGYFGGGSGALYYTGGGGGSSYTDSSLTSTFFDQVTTLGSDTTTAPNNTDSNYISGVAAAVAESDGGNGLVVLEIS
jgi:hypothetical protein